MNRFAILELFAEYDYVNYYTVRLVDDDIEHEFSETEKFYRLYDNEEHSNFAEFDLINRVIDAMGYSEYGADVYLFRFEDAAHALPPHKNAAKKTLGIEINTHTQLRLYCVRLTESVVILLNGGIKTKNEALKCPNVRHHFRLAQSVANAIDQLMLDGIRIHGQEIVNVTGDDEIILYLK